MGVTFVYVQSCCHQRNTRRWKVNELNSIQGRYQFTAGLSYSSAGVTTTVGKGFLTGGFLFVGGRTETLAEE